MMHPFVTRWKLASGELGNDRLRAAMLETGRPIIISTGMSTMAEIDAVVKEQHGRAWDLVVLQCTSAYPCPPDDIGLNMVEVFRERYGCRIGLSDHSGTIYAGLAAAALGTDMIEVHVTMSRDAFGFDVTSSITLDELRQLVTGVRFIERALIPVDKDEMASKLEPMRKLFGEKHKRKAMMA